MILDAVFERFLAASPLSVMARATIEHTFSAESLDELFEQHARRGYTRQLLFSTTVDLMSLVVCGQRPHIKGAHRQLLARVPVSLKSVYEKLQRIETDVSAALVRAVARRCEALIAELEPASQRLLPGYRVRIIDGNHLAGTQKRLAVTRGHTAAVLPGTCLVVLDPDAMLMRDVICCEDGHAHEHAMIDRVVSGIQTRDVWIGDRNFGTMDFMIGTSERDAYFVVRRHKRLKIRVPGVFGAEVETERGWVRECVVRIGSEPRALTVRLVVVRLKEPTQDGDDEVEILTNLPGDVASAVRVSELYLTRWRIEGAFHELTMSLKCELNTLGYPRAALFGFCVAVAAYNVLSVLKASLGAVHGHEKVTREVSGYYMAQEWSVVYAGMMVALPDEQWSRFGAMSSHEIACCLREWAAKVNLKKFQKSVPRKPTQRKPPRIKDRSTHLSTARLLQRAKRDRKTNKDMRKTP
jgi:hypothetical protein